MVCAVLPLMLTSILSEALMVWLGIGVKVETWVFSSIKFEVPDSTR